MSSKEIVKLLRRCMFSDTLLQMAADKIEELEHKIAEFQDQNRQKGATTMPNELKPCKCGAIPKIEERYDTLQIICENCGEKGKLFVGDYYDEAFMMKLYGDEAIEEWNRRTGNG